MQHGLAFRRALANLAREPYGDRVQAFGGDEPSVVGKKIARAITVYRWPTRCGAAG